MHGKQLVLLLMVFGLLAIAAAPANAQSLDPTTINVGCSSFSFIPEGEVIPGDTYEYMYTIAVSPAAPGFPITNTITFTANATGTLVGNIGAQVTGTFPALPSGSYTFNNSFLTLTFNGVNVDHSPLPVEPSALSVSPTSLSCPTTTPPPPPPCSAVSTNGSNFNGTPISAGDYIWFSSIFKASGIPSTGAVLTLTASTITWAGTTISVPNAQITFSPSAMCTSTTFNTTTNTWETTVPIKGDDEIFLTGVAWPVPTGGLPGGTNPVNWEGTFSTNGASGVNIQWQWGAAVYSSFTTNYNMLNIKAGHQTACAINNGDHAGTPEGVNSMNLPWKQFVLGGARGGGGSNWTGSWSGTLSVTPICM